MAVSVDKYTPWCTLVDMSAQKNRTGTEFNKAWNASYEAAFAKYRTTPTAALSRIKSRIIVGHGGPGKHWDNLPEAGAAVVAIVNILATRGELN